MEHNCVEQRRWSDTARAARSQSQYDSPHWTREVIRLEFTNTNTSLLNYPASAPLVGNNREKIFLINVNKKYF